MKNRIECFIEHLEGICGPEANFHKLSEDPLVIIVSFPNAPEKGCMTSFTYGLSLFENASWRLGRPELMISMDGLSNEWGLALGELIIRASGQCAFQYGQMIDFGGKISDGSTMDAFLVYRAESLEMPDRTVNVPLCPINIVQLFPVFRDEFDVIHRLGAPQFLQELGENAFNPARASLSA